MTDIVSTLVDFAACLVSLAGPIVGGIIGSLIAILIWERYRKPKVGIEIPSRLLGGEPAIQDLGPRAFYHLRVVNNGRTPAYNCRIIMRFRDINTGKQLFAVSGKWDRGPQPLLYAPVPKQVLPDGRIETVIGEFPHDFLVPFAEVIDVYPNTPESFCIIVKYEDQEECYGFSAWSYLKGKGHRVDDWKLQTGEYLVEVELTYSGKKHVEKFMLINHSKDMNGVEIKKHDDKRNN